MSCEMVWQHSRILLTHLAQKVPDLSVSVIRLDVQL